MIQILLIYTPIINIGCQIRSSLQWSTNELQLCLKCWTFFNIQFGKKYIN
ncbi:hypothetical protein CBL_10896 [Carabus blaptoides fortunei]